MRMIQYGGALFKGSCPDCGRFIKAARSLSVNLFMHMVNKKENPSVPAVCSQCGDVSISFIEFDC